MGNEQPQEGDQVSWKWGAGHPEGTVAETKSSGDLSIETKSGNTVKKHADADNPAVRISRSSGQDVVKHASELHVEKKTNNASESAQDDTTENNTTAKSSLKRKEQASTPKKQPKKPKKVRTDKEGDEIESDNDDEDDNQDPEMTEDEDDEEAEYEVDYDNDEEDELAEKPTTDNNTTNTDNNNKNKKPTPTEKKSNNTTKSTASSGKAKDPEPKRGSINALLNETDSHHQQHPREAKEVAERKITETVAGGEGKAADADAGDEDAYQPGEEELVYEVEEGVDGEGEEEEDA